ncbi:hypothetical protein STEG23_026120, partial [Scotinomys teguina]
PVPVRTRREEVDEARKAHETLTCEAMASVLRTTATTGPQVVLTQSTRSSLHPATLKKEGRKEDTVQAEEVARALHVVLGFLQ